jgi:hypothetical protein
MERVEKSSKIFAKFQPTNISLLGRGKADK